MSLDKSKALVPQPNLDDTSWAQIIEQIVSDLSDKDLPDKVLTATEMLLCGFPTHEVAKEVGVKPAEVRRWLSKYPVISAVLAEQRPNIIKYRMNQLERQFYQAVQLSGEIFQEGLGGETEAKKIGVLAQHARFIIGLFAGQKIDVRVTHEAGETMLNARKDALDYIAQRMNEIRDVEEPIEVSYRVIDAKFAPKPLIDEDGKSAYGEIGVLEWNDNGYLCHICGTRVQYLQQHIETQHNMEAERYELTFMLPKGSVNGARGKPVD